jgi:LPS export ABC transporter protein LptC
MKRKIFIVCLCLGLVLIFVLRNAEQKKHLKAPSAENTDSRDLEQKVLTFSIDGRSPKGVQQWHLEGNSAEIIGEDIHLNDLSAVAYSDEATIKLTSDNGIYHKKQGIVELLGDVKVVSDDGLTLKTDKAQWSQHSKEIFTDAVVHISKDNIKATGTGGMANSDEKKAMLNKNVTVVIEPDTRVDCDGKLEISSLDNIAVFYDNVIVEDKDGKLLADKLTVNFNPDTKKISEVIAEGNVKVKKGKSYTISEKAIYTDSTKSAKLLGRPRIIIDPEEVQQLDSLKTKTR